MFDKLFLGIAFGFFSCIGFSQSFQATFNAWNGGFAQFTTHDDMVNGKMQTNQLTVQIGKSSGGSINQWKVTVRLLDDYINTGNSSYSVGAQYGQLILNEVSNGGGTQINPSNVPVTLSKFNEMDLIVSNGALVNGTNSQIRYNLFVQGGTHLLVNPNGNYRAVYELKLYGRSNSNQNYTLISTATVNNGSGFQINYSGNFGSQSIVLQNTAGLFNFDFNSVDDYINGKSIEITNGIKVTSYNTYNITVKSSNSEFISSTSSQTIPIGSLRAEASINSSPGNVSFHGPLIMSTTDQALITRSATNPQTLEYNIRMFIPPNTIQGPVEEGTYTAYIYFTIVPN